MNAPRAMGLAPARAETPQVAQGRSPAGPVTAATSGGQAPNSVPYRTPQFLAHAMSDPEAMGVMPVARKLGEKLGCEEMPVIEPIRTQQFRLTRKDLWPPDVWAEMEAIRRGERDER